MRGCITITASNATMDTYKTIKGPCAMERVCLRPARADKLTFVYGRTRRGAADHIRVRQSEEPSRAVVATGTRWRDAAFTATSLRADDGYLVRSRTTTAAFPGGPTVSVRTSRSSSTNTPAIPFLASFSVIAGYPPAGRDGNGDSGY